MAQIVEYDDRFRVHYFTDAKHVPKEMYDLAMQRYGKDIATKDGYIVVDRWDTNGYIMWVGTKEVNTGGQTENVFVPFFVDYSKKFYSRKDVEQFARNIAKCGTCEALNKSIGKLEYWDRLKESHVYPTSSFPNLSPPQLPAFTPQLPQNPLALTAQVPQPQPLQQPVTLTPTVIDYDEDKKSRKSEDFFMKLLVSMLKDQLTPVGKLFLSMLADDPKLFDDLDFDLSTEDGIQKALAFMNEALATGLKFVKDPEDYKKIAEANKEIAQSYEKLARAMYALKELGGKADELSKTLGIPKEELLKRVLNIADEKKEESEEKKPKKRIMAKHQPADVVYV